MISGLSHITFITRDIDKMAQIVVEVLGGKEVYASDGKEFSLSREKFFVAGGMWIAVMEGESLPSKTYNHIAFQIAEEALRKATSKVVALGLEIRSRPRVEGEAKSLYFYTHDNHLIELHTGTLEERLRAYALNP